jgi:hypothetical protein
LILATDTPLTRELAAAGIEGVEIGYGAQTRIINGGARRQTATDGPFSLPAPGR